MADLYIYGDIGDSWWSWWDDEEGDSDIDNCLTGKALAKALNKIPKDEPINLHINSPGGDVNEGLTMYNLLKARDNVTAYIDGYALSCGSFIPLAADTIVSPESSIWMLHNPWGVCMGTANDMRDMAETLDVHRNALLAIYREKTGKTDEELIPVLEKETWMTGSEAAEFGLCQVSDSQPVSNVLPIERGKIANRYKVSASTRKKLAAAGWQLMPARKPIAASANPPIPKDNPMANKTVKAQEIASETAVVEEEETLTPAPVVEPKTPAVDPSIDARLQQVEASLAQKDREIVARDAKIADLAGRLEEMQLNASVTAKFGKLREQYQALAAEFKVRPSEIDACFSGDRASAESILASGKHEMHIFYLEEFLANASQRQPGLPTEFVAAESVKTEEVVKTENPSIAAARAKIANAYKMGAN